MYYVVSDNFSIYQDKMYLIVQNIIDLMSTVAILLILPIISYSQPVVNSETNFMKHTMRWVKGVSFNLPSITIAAMEFSFLFNVYTAIFKIASLQFHWSENTFQNFKFECVIRFLRQFGIGHALQRQSNVGFITVQLMIFFIKETKQQVWFNVLTSFFSLPG